MFRPAFFVVVIVACGVVHAADVSGAVRQPAAPLRVFVAPLKVGAGADKDVVGLFEERVLVAARRHEGFSVVSGTDVAAVVDIEASRQASGCVGEMSCAAEIAGALDAPQLVTGQLGRVGDTWVLVLTRTERATLTVLARVVRESKGTTPEGLLAVIDGAVGELFGAKAVVVDKGGGVSFGVVGGGVAVGVGVVGVVVGSAAAYSSWASFQDTQQKLDDPAFKNDKVKLRETAIQNGEVSNGVALAGWIGGGLLMGVGGAVLGLSLLGGE